MVIVCSECCACNNDDAIYCSICGVQLVSPMAPRELAKRYDDLHLSVGDLSKRNQALEESLRKTTEEIRSITEQLRAEEQVHKTDIERELSRRRSLEDQLQRAMTDLRNLTTQVREGEEVYRRQTGKVAELAETNTRLIQEVKRMSKKPRYCDRCGERLVATANPNVDLCPVCDRPWYISAQPYAPPMMPAGQGWAVQVAGVGEEDYSHPGSMHAGRSWHGIFIHENCGFCGQQLQLTDDPNVLYCPYCGKYQQHIHK